MIYYNLHNLSEERCISLREKENSKNKDKKGKKKGKKRKRKNEKKEQVNPNVGV
jgi:hypothetical protein